MKKFITDIRTLAALLMAGAAFTACSSDDDSIIDEQPVNPAKQTYTFTVKASKGDDGTTRALTLTGEGNKTLKAYWDGTETVTVKEGDTPLGTLTVTPDATDNTQATLSGELDDAPSGNELTLELYSNAYSSQDGTLAYIASHCDYATATTTVAYDAVNKTITGTDADFTNQQAIIKFTLQDKGNGNASISPSAFTVSDGTSTVELTSIPPATYTANGDGVLYVAFPAAGTAKTITLTATVGTATYIYETATAKTFTNGQYYEITVKMMKMKKLGKFSVSSTKQVYFSLGNLQATYDGSSWTWAFAENQWDYIGNAAGNTSINGNGTDSEALKSDWGNTISDGYTWFTLTSAEWTYLFNTRTTTSGVRYAKATVNGKSGVILLPDDWSTSYYSLSSTNTANAVYTTNSITSTDWTNRLEAHGAVFLPAAGYREQASVSNAGSSGSYWSSSSASYRTSANRVLLQSGSLNPASSDYRYCGSSVRLVRQVE